MREKNAYIVELSDVEVYRKKNLILHQVNLGIKKGEFVYLLGPTGSGKTGLLKTISAELPLGGGEARVMDFDLNQLDEYLLPMLRRHLGILSADYPLLAHYTVFDNLELVLKSTDWIDTTLRRSRIFQLLDLLRISSLAYQYPPELSKAQTQKVLLARALLNRPALLLADEPTAALDTESREDILVFLHAYSQSEGMSVLLATNDPSIPEQFPCRVWRCDGGRVKTIQHLSPPKEDRKET